MATPITQKPRTGRAGEYDEAQRARKLRLAEWLGLSPENVMRADVTETQSGVEVAVVTTLSSGTTKRGEVRAYSIDGLTETLTATIYLESDAGASLVKHMGPPPKPPLSIVLWGPSSLPQGMKLYDVDGNEVGEVEHTVHGVPGWWGRW